MDLRSAGISATSPALVLARAASAVARTAWCVAGYMLLAIDEHLHPARIPAPYPGGGD